MPTETQAPSSNWKSLKRTLPAGKNDKSKPNKRQLLNNKKGKNTNLLSFEHEEATTTTRTKELKGKSSIIASVSLDNKKDIPPAGSVKELDTKATSGKYFAMDCEFVGVGPGGSESALARVSIVNYEGKVVYDTFVRTSEPVSDYRTWVSGVRPKDLSNAPQFKHVQKCVSDLLKKEGMVLVGHAIQHDLKALLLSHPRTHIRDTSSFGPIRTAANTKRPGLKKLCHILLDFKIQDGEHSSVEDAKATMAIFKLFKSEWESSVKTKSVIKKKTKKTPRDDDNASESGNDTNADGDADAANATKLPTKSITKTTTTKSVPTNNTKSKTGTYTATTEATTSTKKSSGVKRKRDSDWWKMAS